MNNRTLRFIDHNSAEWHRMWKLLSEKNYLLWGTRDNVCRNEECRESWQYMGTVDQPGQPSVHQFRHRMHPRSKRREYLNIPCSEQPIRAVPVNDAPDLELGGVLDSTGHVHSDAAPGL